MDVIIDGLTNMNTVVSLNVIMMPSFVKRVEMITYCIECLEYVYLMVAIRWTYNNFFALISVF